jgi:abhydrolase domain-containing protein 12
MLISQAINVPMLFVHAEDDWEIPHTHSDTLFDALLEPLLPPHPALPLHPGAWSKEDWDEFVARLSARGEHRAQIVAQRDVVGLGMVREFAREPGVGERVVVLKTREGGHDGVLGLEGVQDVMRSVFGLE